jgi:hypothetical protein
MTKEKAWTKPDAEYIYVSNCTQTQATKKKKQLAAWGANNFFVAFKVSKNCLFVVDSILKQQTGFVVVRRQGSGDT